MIVEVSDKSIGRFLIDINRYYLDKSKMPTKAVKDILIRFSCFKI